MGIREDVISNEELQGWLIFFPWWFEIFALKKTRMSVDLGSIYLFRDVWAEQPIFQGHQASKRRSNQKPVNIDSMISAKSSPRKQYWEAGFPGGKKRHDLDRNQKSKKNHAKKIGKKCEKTCGLILHDDDVQIRNTKSNEINVAVS